MKKTTNIIRIIRLTKILLKEQLSEPISFIWILASPAAMFYFLRSRTAMLDTNESYLGYAGWFYGYVAATVAMFGFSYYLIGRRESGFVRCFIYHRLAMSYYMLAHFIAYSCVAIVYAVLFYLVTKPAYGSYNLDEALILARRFYTAFLSVVGLASIASLLPLKFNTAGIFFSVVSLSMIAISGEQLGNQPTSIAYMMNPLLFLERIVTGAADSSIVAFALFANLITLVFTVVFFRINPVWNRY